MPIPLSSDARNAGRARRVSSAWLLDLYCAEGTLRVWDQFEAFTFGGDVYEAGADKWGILSELRCGRDLVPSTLSLWLDGSGEFTPGSLIYRFIHRTWHGRRLRLRQVLFAVDSNYATPIGVYYRWQGLMDTLPAPFGGKGPARFTLNAESGAFRAKQRDMTTLTDVDQRRRAANDGSFKNTAVKPFQDIPFGEEWSNIPGATANGGAAAPSANANSYAARTATWV